MRLPMADGGEGSGEALGIFVNLPVRVHDALGAAVASVEAGNRFLCHPAVTFLQFQGAVLLALLAVGWAWAGAMRRRELDRLRREGLSSNTGAGQVGGLPGVTVVLPVKGCRTHSVLNWQSHLAQHYPGPLEFIFVVDGEDDPAIQPMRQLVEAAKGVDARVLVSGQATSNSQKIHNLQAGIQAAKKEHKYVLCLDDDVVLHPSSLAMMVARMEAEPGVFMATGYPLDLPPPGANLLTYCVLVYHAPLLIAFSIRQRTSFVWGGCMLMPLHSLRTDEYGFMRAWSEGGYSDDLIVAAKCAEHKLRILCPSFAIFPQWLDGDYTGARYWNYLRRQLYVMDTYSGSLNRRVNHAMLALHSYASWAIVLPALTVGARMALLVAELALLPTQSVYDGPGTAWQWLAIFGAGDCPAGTVSVLLLLGALAGAHAALRWMTDMVLQLFQFLSPPSAELSPDIFNWVKLWAAFLVNNALLPPCAALTWLLPHVDWSGVRYHKRGGRVVRVRHLPPDAAPFRSAYARDPRPAALHVRSK